MAYDVATLELMWKTGIEARVRSIAYHDGLVLVAADDAPLFVLSAEDGSVVRRLARVDKFANGISVFAGLIWRCCWLFVWRLISITDLLCLFFIFITVAHLLAALLSTLSCRLTPADQPTSQLKFSD